MLKARFMDENASNAAEPEDLVPAALDFGSVPATPEQDLAVYRKREGEPESDVASQSGAVSQDFRRTVPPLQRQLRSSASSPALNSTRSRKSNPIASSPFRVPPPFQPPDVDAHGHGVMRLRHANHYADWDERHQLLLDSLGEPAADNGLLPRGRRTYFAPVETEDDLKAHLTGMMSTSSARSLKSVLHAIDGKKTPRPQQVPITADVGPPIIPTRHTFGGTMRDADGGERPWNDRWHRGVQQLNEGLHKSHREYFSQRSLFAVSDSQRWRRYNDQQVGPGEWVSFSTKKTRFPPMGA